METSPRVNLTIDEERLMESRRRWAAMQRRVEWERRHPWRRRLRSWSRGAAGLVRIAARRSCGDRARFVECDRRRGHSGWHGCWSYIAFGPKVVRMVRR